MADKKKKEFKYMAYHYEAIELRYQGKTYNEIAAYLTEKFKKDFKDERMRQWFKSGGILEAMYMDHSRKENDRRRKFVMEEMKKLYSTIPKNYQEILERPITELTKGQRIMQDSVKAKVLKDLCGILGFTISDLGDGNDPLEEYFVRAEKEIDDNEGEAPKTS